MTIGIPTRNGADTLPYALRAFREQTYRTLEIIVADNASDDDTSQVLTEAVEHDPRIRVIRHRQPVTMWSNHETTYRHALGKYLMLASDNDVFAPDWVEWMVAALEARPDAALAFGEVAFFEDYDNHTEAASFDYDCSTRGVSDWRRLVMPKNGGYAAQGMIRRTFLDHYRWWDHSTSPDWPLTIYLMIRGEILQVRGTTVYRPNISKSGEDRARLQSYGEIEKFPTIRLSWICARSAAAAATAKGRRRSRLVDFVLIFVGLIWENRQNLIRSHVEGSAATWAKHLRAAASRIRRATTR